VRHYRSPSLQGHTRPARYVAEELIHWPLSGSIAELPHVAKVGEGHLRRNNRIGTTNSLNQHCVLALDLESILLVWVREIFLQQYRPKADIRGQAKHWH
jgi:hypothetical protein